MSDTQNNFWISGYAMDGAGAGLPIDPTAPLPAGRDIWVHLNARGSAVRRYLVEDMKLDPFVVKSLLAEETRPRFEEFTNGVLLVLRGVNHNDGEAPEDMVSIRLWVDEHRVISTQKKNHKSVREISERFKLNRGPHNTGEFISILLTHLTDAMETKITSLEDETDAIEDRVLDDTSRDMRQDVMNLRKQAILYRRHILPQRDAVHLVRRASQPWMTKLDRRYLQDTEDRLSRYIEDLDAIRDRTEIVHEQMLGAMTVRLNRNMYVLSFITAVFMPLTFVTGLLGSNIGGIPGAHEPKAFITLCLILTLVIIIQMFIFRKMKWF